MFGTKKTKGYKKDFPIFQNNKNLVFFDSGASSQKPSHVINGISDFLSNSYANIHRGSYELSKQSEYFFEKSKEMVANLIHAKSKNEIVYTYNATYAFNLLISTLGANEKINKGDKVLLGVSEHHANIVPWQILQKQIGFEIEYIDLDNNFELDIEDFEKKYTDDVTIVSVSHVSNATGSINPIETIGKKIRRNTIFIVDGSQSIPHFDVNINKIGCDFLIFTAHKIMANTGIGVLRGKKYLLDEMNPVRGGGDMIKDVTKDTYTVAESPTKFEPGTPNIVGAVSLLKALEYIEQIGGMDNMRKHEQELIKYTLTKIEKFQNKFPDTIKLIGKNTLEGRVGVFSFVMKDIKPKAVGEIMAENNICIRAGGHCTHPLMTDLDLKNGTFRMSTYIYNDKDDIDAFFTVLKEIVIMGKSGNEGNDDELC